jgi:hypothetical protein
MAGRAATWSRRRRARRRRAGGRVGSAARAGGPAPAPARLALAACPCAGGVAAARGSAPRGSWATAPGVIDPWVHHCGAVGRYASGLENMEGPERQTGASRSDARGQPFRQAHRPLSSAAPADLNGRSLPPDPTLASRTLGNDPENCQWLLHHIRLSVCDCRSSRLPNSSDSHLGSCDPSLVPSALAAVVDMGIQQAAKPHVKRYFAIPREVPRHFWFIPGTAPVPHKRIPKSPTGWGGAQAPQTNVNSAWNRSSTAGSPKVSTDSRVGRW